MNSPVGIDGRCLHLVMGPGKEALHSCLSCCRPGDSIVFLDAGVMHLLGLLTDLPPDLRESACCARADAEARGMLAVAEESDARLLSDAEFSGLLREHDHCLSWK